MIPSTLTIPCNAHRQCFFHRDHSGATSNRVADTLKTHGRTNNAAGKKNGPALASTGTVRSRIQELPHELLLIVFEELGELDLMSVALTCRTFFTILQSTLSIVTGHFKKRRYIHTYSTNDFLRLLVRDLSEQYWHCEDCEILHTRSVPVAPAVGLLGKFFDPRNFFPIQKQYNADSTFKIHIANAVIYALAFPTAQAVVDRHFQASKGLCINTLKCGGAHIFPGIDASGADDRTLRYTFEPKIVLDRLLLKATYSWESNGPGSQNGSLAGHSRARWQLENTGLWLCAHLDIRHALEVAARHPLTREEVRCEQCPTQYWVQQNPEDTTGCLALIQVWHNLGSCRSPREERWTHMTSGGEKAVTYKWRKMSVLKGIYGDEDVRDAFDWIGFSSRRAFVRFQNAIAHRDGHIYPDPHSEDRHRRRKRLPASVAEYL